MLLVKQGNRLKYIDLNGEEHLDYRKQWLGPKLDTIMAEYDEKMKPSVVVEDATEEQIEEATTNE